MFRAVGVPNRLSRRLHTRHAAAGAGLAGAVGGVRVRHDRGEAAGLGADPAGHLGHGQPHHPGAGDQPAPRARHRRARGTVLREREYKGTREEF